MIKKNKDGNITVVWNDKNFKAIEIVECLDYMLGKEKKFYRIDFNSSTVDCEDKYSSAEKVARKYLK